MTNDTIPALQKRLKIYRSNLAHLLQQVAHAGGWAKAPVGLVNDIRETRDEIAQAKQHLRQLGAEAEDHPDDFDPQEAAATSAPTLRLTLLHALLHDHTGFMQTRLESFVGRAEELREVQRRVAELLPTGGYVTITAQAGQGKSCLIAKLVEQVLRERVGEDLPLAQLVSRAGPAALAYHFIPFSPGPDHQVGLLRNLMARLILKYDLPEIYVATDSRPALRDYFVRVLEEVAARGGQEVVYIDGLDQIEEDASGVRDLSFLPTKPPAGIVFVLGTRPNDTLQPLELRKPHQQYWLPPLSRGDFDLVLQHRSVTLTGDLADRFYRVMEANALYLDLVARELAEAGAFSPEQIIARIADNPENLFSLAIERLKRPALPWRETIKPILGLLLAAQAPLSTVSLRALLSQDKDTVQDALMRLGGLLARDGEGRYTLFHLKLRDFLREATNQTPDRSVFGTDDEEDYHQRLADWCERGGLACIWQDHPRDAGEQERRAYARQHLITHLCRAQDWSHLWEVLDQGEYGKAKLRYDPSTRSFVLDLDVVRQAMVTTTGGDFNQSRVWLSRLWKYCLLRCSLSSQADNYPEELIELLAQLGREQEAIGLAEVLTDHKRKSTTLLRIGVAIGRNGHLMESMQILARALEVLHTINDNDRFKIINEFMLIMITSEQFDAASILANKLSSKQKVDQNLANIALAQLKAHQFNGAIKIALDLSDKQEQIRILREVFLSLIKAQEFEYAIELANQFPNTRNFNVMLTKIAITLVEIQQFNSAITIVDKLLDMQDCAEILEDVVVALAQAKQFNTAITLINQLSYMKDHSKMLTNVGVEMARSQNIKAAIAISNQIPELNMRIKILAEVSVAQAQVQQFEESIALAKWILKVEEQYPENSEVLISMAVALVYNQQFESAINLAYEMCYRWDSPDALTSVTIALIQKNQIDEAVQIILDNWWIWPSSDLLTEVSVVLAHKQEIDAINVVIQTIPETEHIEVLPEVIKALVHKKHIESAMMFFNYIRHEKIRDELLYEISIGLAQAQQFDTAIKLTSSIYGEQIRTKALTEVAVALAQAQRFDAAITLAKEFLNEQIRTKVLAEVAIALAQAQQFDAATALIREPLDEQKRTKVFAELAIVLAQAQQFEAATVLAQELLDEQRRTRVLTEVAIALARAQQVEAAIALAQRFFDEQKREEILAKIAMNLAQIQQTNTAIVLLDKISDNWIISEIMAIITLNTAKSQHFKDAIDFCSRIPDIWKRSEAMAEISTLLARSKYFKDAIDFCSRIPDIRKRSEAMAEISTLLVQSNQLDIALNLFQQIPDWWKRNEIHIYIELAISLVNANYTEKAIEILQYLPDIWRFEDKFIKLLKILADLRHFEIISLFIQKAPVDKNRPIALSTISTALAQIQQFDMAIELSQQISVDIKRYETIMNISIILSQFNHFNEAIKLAQQIPINENRYNAISNISINMARLQMLDTAYTLTKQIETFSKQARALSELFTINAQFQRNDMALVLYQRIIDIIKQITSSIEQFETIIIILRHFALNKHYEAFMWLVFETITIEDRWLNEIIELIRTFQHLPTVLTLVQRLWSQATRRDDLYALLPAAAPLFVADPTLLPQILAGEEWVKEQLKW